MVPLTDYERERQERIARNKALLASLNIPKPISSSVKANATSNSTANSKKRKQRVASARRDPNVVLEERLEGTRRTSARLQNKLQKPYDDNADDNDENKPKRSRKDESDYSSQGEESSDDETEGLENKSSRVTDNSESGLKRRIVSGRNVAHIDRNFDRPNPKVFGEIPGIKNGHWWEGRMMASRDGCHAPVVAGISGNEREGCWSIALSGGYEDDVDEGYCFTYTGSGGRDLKGTKNNPKNLRTAPQSKDQTLTSLNLALKVSCDTGNPIRVIRGYKGHSKWAPRAGYRYDGLYKVVKHWEEIGLSGFLVMKYAFARLEDQEPIRLHIQEGEDVEELED